MNKAESIFKWGIAIVTIFGLLTMLFLMQWGNVLKILLIIMSVVLIGIILLQSGRGGGLAAIGGLADQTTFGTRTSTFLGKVTYLVAAAVFITIIFLTKSALSPVSQHELPSAEATAPAGHEHAAPPSETGSLGGIGGGESPIGMKEVEKGDTDKTDTDKEGVGSEMKEVTERPAETDKDDR